MHVVFQHYVISNAERYFPKSQQFLPERWIGSGSVEAPAPRHAFASLPFGYGRRMCLGRRFAELEIIILLSKVCAYSRSGYEIKDMAVGGRASASSESGNVGFRERRVLILVGF